MHTLNDLLSTADVANKLNISKYTLYNWVRDKHIPCVRFGQDLKFDPADLSVWLAAHKQAAAQ